LFYSTWGSVVGTTIIKAQPVGPYLIVSPGKEA